MKQEDKELLLKDLCARLPYRVKIKTSYNKIDEPIELRFVNPISEYFAVGGKFTLISGLDFDAFECKPYLFPLPSMTKEQKIECFKGTPLEIDKYGDVAVKDDFYGNSQYTDLEIYLEVIDWLNKNYFDYRGLIKKGLAIDATGLNIY